MHYQPRDGLFIVGLMSMAMVKVWPMGVIVANFFVLMPMCVAHRRRDIGMNMIVVRIIMPMCMLVRQRFVCMKMRVTLGE